MIGDRRYDRLLKMRNEKPLEHSSVSVEPETCEGKSNVNVRRWPVPPQSSSFTIWQARLDTSPLLQHPKYLHILRVIACAAY